jgi:hypothetical protein
VKYGFALFAACLGLAAPASAPADDALLAAFDIADDTIELEFENQAPTACLLSAFQTRDALEAELQALGFRLTRASTFVLTVLTWGTAIDDYHCAIVVETVLLKRAARMQLGERAITGDVRLWGASDLLSGPKIRLQERIDARVLQHAGRLRGAIGN